MRLVQGLETIKGEPKGHGIFKLVSMQSFYNLEFAGRMIHSRRLIKLILKFTYMQTWNYDFKFWKSACWQSINNCCWRHLRLIETLDCTTISHLNTFHKSFSRIRRFTLENNRTIGEFHKLEVFSVFIQRKYFWQNTTKNCHGSDRKDNENECFKSL